MAQEQRFTTELWLGGKTATGLQVPPEVVEALGAGKRPPVVVGFSGHTYRSTVAVMGGRYLVPVSAEQRAAAGVAAGDLLDVTLTLDTEPRDVALPDDLAAALTAAGVREAFDALAPSRRKEHVRSVADAKKPETRERRVAIVVAGLTP